MVLFVWWSMSASGVKLRALLNQLSRAGESQILRRASTARLRRDKYRESFNLYLCLVRSANACQCFADQVMLAS